MLRKIVIFCAIFFSLGLAFPGISSPESEEGVRRPDQRDYETIFQKVETAAKSGNRGAQYILGLLYFYGGRPVTQDFVLAHMWMNLAASCGRKEAAEVREIIASNMTPEQIAEAQKLAREWSERNKCLIYE